jgi:hypothetical protein
MSVDDFEVSPVLAITSAEMRSGKTRVLDCLELLVPHPFRVVTPSEAVVYTVLAQRPRRTMLLDDDPDTCPLCGGDWLICGCDPEADEAWDQLGGDAA